MFKRVPFWISLIILLIFSYYKFVIRGNNRLTILHHHGLWLPSSVKNIKFTRYPDFPNISDNAAQNECELTKTDYYSLLHKQEYKYVIRRDTIRDEGTIITRESEYLKIPENLQTKFPALFKCRSSTGDFLIISAEIKDSNSIKVVLATDWN